MVLAGVGFDFLHEGVLGGVSEVALSNVAGKEDGFRAEEAEAFEGHPFVVGKFEGDGGFVFVEVGEEAVDQFNIFSGFLVAAAGFFDALFFLAFEGGEVGEDKFGIDDLNIAEGVNGTHVVDDVFVLKATDDVNDGVDLTDIGEEFIAKAFAFTGACDESGDIDKFDGGGDDAVGFGDFPEGFETGIGYLHDADVWVDGTEGIVGGLGFAGTGECVEKSALSDVG